ncbi:hypothetical protein CBS9595_004317 [Malassezia furfur]|nr:hypothetical protein CBS9595_004317 [Malassezia furfur]
MPVGSEAGKTSEPHAPHAPHAGGKRKHKSPATPVSVRTDPPTQNNTPSQSGSQKRKKPRHRALIDPNVSMLSAPGGDLSTSAWQTIVAFRAPFGKAFDRVLDAGFTLGSVRQMVAQKYRIPHDVAIGLSYVAPDGTHIDLDDNEDFRAFQVHAAREATITVHVDAPAASVGTASASEAPADPAEPTATAPMPAALTQAKARGRRGRGAPRLDDTPDDSASATEVSQFFDAERTTEEAPATPAKRGRKRKADVQAAETQPAPAAEPATESAAAPAAEASAPVPEAPAAPTEDDDASSDDDVPLSSQPPASSQADSPEKPKRTRRTKAEMEAFRAEKAAKKAAKEQERAEKHAAKHGAADASTAGEADASQAQDETVIVHDIRNEEHSAAASAAVQALVETGIDAMQARLAELKAKKQRKNAVEREEQKMLVSMVKGMSVTPSEADVSSRELPRNAPRAGTDARLTSHESDLDPASVATPTDAPADADESASSTGSESRDYFSQPESHANVSSAQVQGPAPRPERPMESTPQRAGRAEASESSTARRSMSGAFMKLSDLRPSALRRSFSQKETAEPTEEEGTGTSGADAAHPAEDASGSSSESESESSGDSSDTDTPPPSQARVLPASKMAGASAEASAADASKAKKKRSFFSVLS